MRQINMRRALHAALMLCVALLSHQLLMYNMRYTLMPHARVLEACFGIEFTFIPELGYLSRASNFAITPDCMGAKLFIAAFLMLSLGFLEPSTAPRRQAWRLTLYYVGSMLGALMVSILRIAISLPFTWWPSGQLIHTLISLVIYFGALLALYMTAQTVQNNRLRNPGRYLRAKAL